MQCGIRRGDAVGDRSLSGPARAEEDEQELIASKGPALFVAALGQRTDLVFTEPSRATGTRVDCSRVLAGGGSH